MCDKQTTTKAHPHAASMLLYAQDAAETDRPWLRWQYSHDGCWYACDNNPSWGVDGREYRRKPRTIKINGFDIPEPCYNPKHGEKVFLVAPTSVLGIIEMRYQHDSANELRASRGLFHTTELAAACHTNALLSFATKQP